MIMGSIMKRDMWVKEDLIPDQYINTRSTSDALKAYQKENKEDLGIWQADSFDGKTKAVNMFTAKTIPSMYLTG